MTSKLLWTPTQEMMEKSNLHQYFKWLEAKKGLTFTEYDALWKWSVDQPAAFWESLWEYFEIMSHTPYSSVISGEEMPHYNWFEGSTLNYAEHIFRRKNEVHPAILFQSENQHLIAISWEELADKVAILQGFLQGCGVGKGDRVVAFIPNIPEATIAFLATVSLGAVWSSCSPDFGTGSVVDRFKQISPKVLITVDGYRYGGKSFDRREVVGDITSQITSIERVILIDSLDAEKGCEGIEKGILWKDVMELPAEALFFEPVPFSHPIWVLYSSGTTGAPKAITHGHGGVLLEHYKYLAFHNDVHPGERFFWFSTTGWMMWNFVQASLLMGATIVLYDGSPGYPTINVLWKFAEETGINHFGTSAPYLVACMKAGITPGKEFDLSQLRSIGSTGSPLPPEAFDYIYEHIKKDVWLCSMSGGTDVCTAFVGGNPLLPVYEGEIQCRALGCRMESWDELGRPLVDEVGEMVITNPMPSMPIYFWNDPDGQKYLSSYFEMYKGVWRHGDWLKITEKGSLIIYGRSDATLNRQGVRIGTAEIYRAVDKVEEVRDSLILNLELSGGQHYMPLFVVMQEGEELTDVIKRKINTVLKTEYSPRHVPDEIIEVEDIPYTISGKKMEAPVKKILMGIPLEKAVNIDSMKNPWAVHYFISFADRFKGEFFK